MKSHVQFLRKIYQTRQLAGRFTVADNCLKCHKHKDELPRCLELHHKIALKNVDPKSNYDPNVQDNLVTLCHECHKGYHVSYEHMDIDEWVATIPLEEVYQKLAEYRAERKRRDRAAIRKHHPNRKKR